jgi:phosphoserine phosphatase
VYDWKNDLHLLGLSGRFIVIKAGASVPELFTETFYSK